MLILQDGTRFDGISIGVDGTRSGMVALYTGVVGYEEVMTDPANAGRILVMTYPLIGNYGINPRFNESKKVWCSGLVIKENSRIYSNWQAEGSFEGFLENEDVVCLSGVDTRTLAVKIRDSGEQWGTISSRSIDKPQPQKNLSFLKEISVDRVTHAVKGKGKKIVIIDLGVQNSILAQLEKLGYDVWLVPYNFSSSELLKLKPDGVIISNGPEEDPELNKTVGLVKDILGKVHMLGISTGHEVIAKALGGKIKKLKIGHRGVNYPVISEGSFKGEITVQNHSFVVDEFSMDKDVEIIERNLNDKTIEKMESAKLKFVSIQYYPASPGLGEPNRIFSEFLGGRIHAKA